MTPLRSQFLDIARAYGVRDEVAALIEELPDPQPEGTLGALLLKTREAQGLTLRQVRDRCTLSRTQLSFYEHGTQKNPGIRTYALLARGYGLPLWKVLAAAYQDIQLPVRTRVRQRPKG